MLMRGQLLPSLITKPPPKRDTINKTPRAYLATKLECTV
jgi:hypothetical protein